MRASNGEGRPLAGTPSDLAAAAKPHAPSSPILEPTASHGATDTRHAERLAEVVDLLGVTDVEAAQWLADTDAEVADLALYDAACDRRQAAHEAALLDAWQCSSPRLAPEDFSPETDEERAARVARDDARDAALVEAQAQVAAGIVEPVERTAEECEAERARMAEESREAGVGRMTFVEFLLLSDSVDEVKREAARGKAGGAAQPTPADVDAALASIKAERLDAPLPEVVAWVRALAQPAAPAPRSKDDQAGSSARQVVEHVAAHYDLLVTPAAEPFAVPRTGPRLPVMLGERGGSLRQRVTAALYDSLGKVPRAQAVDDGFRVVLARAAGSTTSTPLHLRVADLGERLVVDLGEPGSARCVVVDRTGWTVQENPPDGVLFRRTSATRALPTPLRGGSLDRLRDLLGFDADDQRWALVRGWLVGSLFAERPRPMLTFVGAPGSAKTTRARLVVSVLDPRAELGSNFGKAIIDDQTKALSRFLVSYDNLASVSEAVSDHLCRLVTGDEIDRKRLYTDADLVTITYRRTGVMTAVTLPGLRADALERVVLLHLDRIHEAGRRSEAALRGAFDEAHPSILGAVFDALVGTLARLPAASAADVERPRMSDYYDVLAAYDDGAARAYREAVADGMADAAEADPFVVAVRAWLVSVGGQWTGLPSDAWQAANTHRRQTAGGFDPAQWWPKSGVAFGQALTKASEPLRAVGITQARSKSNGRRLLSLSMAQEEVQR